MSIADAITLLRKGWCPSYGRHEAAKTCDVCIRVDAAVRAIEDLDIDREIAVNVRRRLEEQIAASPDERVRRAEVLVELYLHAAQEHQTQRDHATRHMMAARRERDAALKSLDHVNAVSVQTQDEIAVLHAEKEAVRRAGFGWVYALDLVAKDGR